jgi:hypothetical protein
MKPNYELIKEILLHVAKYPNDEIALGNSQNEKVVHCEWLIKYDLIEADINQEYNNQKGIMGKRLTSSGDILLKRIMADPSHLEIIIESHIKIKERGH